MKLNSEKLRKDFERKIAALEQQKQSFREQIAQIDEKVKGLHATIEALEKVVREASFLDSEPSDFEVELKTPVEPAFADTGPAPQKSDEFEPVEVGSTNRSSRDVFDEEDEETMRMVESLFTESDVENAESVPSNGRTRSISENVSEELSAVQLEPERAPVASEGSDNSESLVPRFLKRYL